jgi:hypothetical protein
VIPEQHWRPLLHVARSVKRGTPADFRPRRGLRALEQPERDRLREAIVGRLPASSLRAADGAEGARLVADLRRVGERGGIPVGATTALDGEIAVFLFEDVSRAVRDQSMRRLLAEGAESNDLRALEDLAAHLARVPADAWEGKKANGGRGRAIRPRSA